MTTVAPEPAPDTARDARPGPTAQTAQTAQTALREYSGGPGRTTIADSVAEKIAARAVGETGDVGGVADRVHVTTRISALPGLSIRLVDITVASLHHPRASGRVLR